MRIIINRIGEKIGSLTIKELIRYDQAFNKDPVFLFECICGNYRTAKYRVVKNGKSQMCKECASKRIGNKHPEWQGCGELSKDLFNSYYHSAKSRNLEFTVSIEYLWELFQKQNGLCAFTKWKLYFPPSYKAKKDKTASLDRINSTLGYIEGNLQWVHQDVNYMKSNLDNDYFINICRSIASNC